MGYAAAAVAFAERETSRVRRWQDESTSAREAVEESNVPVELVTELRASGAEALAAMAAVPANALGNPGYEQGWTVRQIMAHVAAMEFAYRRLPEVANSPG